MDSQQQYLINPDAYIILVGNRNDQRLLRIKDHKNFKWRKIPMKLSSLAKFQYYQPLELGNDKIVPCDEEIEESEVDDIEDYENNKEIYSLQHAQKLQAEQIQKIKNSSKNPEEIIKKIASSNEQFQKRTLYSKEKYIEKKKRKYMFIFHVEPTTIENIHKYYYESDPKVVGFMRWDILAFLLLQASPFKHVFLAQITKGMVLGSLLMRQVNSIHTFSDEKKHIKRFPIVEQLNIKKQAISKVKFYEWNDLQNQQTMANVHYDNVILAGHYDFAGILKQILKFIRIGATVCFYCPIMQPLNEAIQVMRQNNFIHIKLFDSWCREQQVLKNRTHPMMMMNSHSGYLLVGIRV